MKLTVWQMIAAAAVIFAAIICAHVFAKDAVPLVVSLAGTLFALFIQRKDPPNDPPKDPPTLTVIGGGLSMLALVAAIGAGVSACAPAASTPWDLADEQCTAQARSAFDAGASPDVAEDVYADCMCLAGHCSDLP